MSSKGVQDFGTGVYRCKDPIKNFKIKVKLQQDRTSLIPLPDFEAKPVESNDDRTLKGVECEERIISWQEKIFSPFEISFYSHSGNCHTPLEEKYHNEVTTLLGNSDQSTRIFTYTNADNFRDNEHVNSVTTEETAITVLSEGMAEMQQKRRIGQSKMSSKEISLANRHIINYNPTGESKKVNHFLQSAYQTFYILADLSTKESSEEDWIGQSEYILCTVKYDDNSNTLFVTPDFSHLSFNGQSTPYCIEVDGDSRNVYQYWLEHASEKFIEEDWEKEEAIISQLLDRQLDLRQLKVGSEFEAPRSNVIMMFIMGEVVCAEDFDYDDLFVHFLFELPKGWSCEKEEQLAGVTHKSRTNGTGMAHFGHLFETHLMLKVESLPPEADSVPRWPQLFAEILSLDSWGRFRVEGYTFTKVPPHPGQHDLALASWRPLVQGVTGELRRFFVGGSPGLQDLSVIGVPTTFKGDRLSKLGLNTVSSGTLHVHLNVIHQSSMVGSELSGNEVNQQNPSFLLERISASSIVNSVNSVMAAFKRAHERMLKAREGLDD